MYDAAEIRANPPPLSGMQELMERVDSPCFPRIRELRSSLAAYHSGLGSIWPHLILGSFHAIGKRNIIFITRTRILAGGSASISFVVLLVLQRQTEIRSYCSFAEEPIRIMEQ